MNDPVMGPLESRVIDWPLACACIFCEDAACNRTRGSIERVSDSLVIVRHI